MIRKLPILLLGAFLALGLGLSAVQAGEMAVKMTLSSDMGADMGSPGSGDCTGCGGDDGNAKTGACHPICTVAAVAVLPWGPVVAVSASDRPVPPASPGFPSRSAAPDPSPPRGRVPV